jgi:hypothetical protein
MCVASDLIRVSFLVPARRIVSLGVSPEVEAARLIKSSTTPYGAKRRKACWKVGSAVVAFSAGDRDQLRFPFPDEREPDEGGSEQDRNGGDVGVIPKGISASMEQDAHARHTVGIADQSNDLE